MSGCPRQDPRNRGHQSEWTTTGNGRRTSSTPRTSPRIRLRRRPVCGMGARPASVKMSGPSTLARGVGWFGDADAEARPVVDRRHVLAPCRGGRRHNERTWFSNRLRILSLCSIAGCATLSRCRVTGPCNMTVRDTHPLGAGRHLIGQTDRGVGRSGSFVGRKVVAYRPFETSERRLPRSCRAAVPCSPETTPARMASAQIARHVEYGIVPI